MNYGSGTDPIEGSSLAISILEYLNKIGCITLSTTHYDELKKFVLSTPEFENASCEFDLDNLKPTFRLLMGIPGSSNAFAICKRLGLADDLIENAKSRVNDKDSVIEDILNKLQADKILIEKEKENILKDSTEINKLKLELEKEKDFLHQNKSDILKKARLEARSILIDAKAEADELIRQINKETNLNTINQKRTEFKNKLSNISNDLLETTSNNSKNIIDISKLKLGMDIFIPSLNKNAVILSMPDENNNINVQAGVMKFKINIADIKLVNENKNSNKISYNNSSTMKISTEINFIGYTVDETLPILDKYLDNAHLAKLSTIRIVHGKGTGALKKGIHAFLKTHPHVKSFRLGTFGEGEAGVTVVEIKN